MEEALQPVQDAILTKERLEDSTTNPEEKPKINIKTTAWTGDNVMTSYYLTGEQTDLAGKKHKNVSGNMKIVKKLRAELLDLEDCIPFESIIIQVRFRNLSKTRG